MADTKKDDGEKPKLLVHLLVISLGVTSWSIMNGLWVELPILVAHLPEGWTLPSLLTIISQFGNLGPLAFVFLTWLFPRTKLETPVSIVVVIALATCAGLYGLLWKETAVIAGHNTSVAILTLTLLQAIFAATSSMSYLAFMSHLKARYISSIFIGQGLSGLLPAFIAIGQGAGDVKCLLNSSAAFVEDRSSRKPQIESPNNGTTVVAVNVEPRFSVTVFFLLLCVMGVLSLLSVLLLVFHPYCRTEHVNPEEEENCQLLAKKNRMDSKNTVTLTDEQSKDKENNESFTKVVDSSAEEHHNNFDKVTFRKPPLHEKRRHNASQDEENEERLALTQLESGTVTTSLEVRTATAAPPGAAKDDKLDEENEGGNSVRRWESWYLLSLLIWINVLQTSYVLAIQVYSSLPYGLAIYHGVTKAENIVDPLACVVTLFVTAKRTRVISGLTLLGTLFAAYIIAMAAMSPRPVLVDETMGGVLVIGAWVMCTVLMVYSKVSIASVMRSQGRKSLIWTGASSQLGALIGAILAYVMINQMDLFKDEPWC